MLFIIYTNKMNDKIVSRIAQFADVTKRGFDVASEKRM